MQLCDKIKNMKKLITLFFTVFSFHLFAQEMTCLEKLLPNNRHSGVHQVSREEWADDKEILDVESAKAALNFLTQSKLLCRSHEITVKVGPTCSQISADLTQSQACFAFTNLGYFFISRDMGRNTNFIFSKDKRFAE
jgi:hypothetical protein